MSLNVLKAIVAAVALIGVTLMTLHGDLDDSSATLLFGTVLGYVLGNGVQARAGGDVPGIIRPKPSGRRADDRTDLETD